MKNSVKYSVVIPIYNAQITLERCLNSLLKQSRADVELIAINDGSVDASRQILDAFKQKYGNLIVIDKEKTGVSAARNDGMSIAKGTYITFVDSDDYVSDDYFAALDSMDDSDLVVFNSQNVGSDSSSSDLFIRFEKERTVNECIEALMVSRKIKPPWNKRFKNEIIEKHSLRFTKEFQIGEDFDFCMAYVLHCTSVCVKNKVLYYSDVSERGSLSRKYRPNLSEQMTNVFKHIEKNISCKVMENERLNRLIGILDYLYVQNVFTCVAEEFKTGKPHYWHQKNKYALICRQFQYRIGEKKAYCNWMHRCLRLLVGHGIVFPIYIATYLVKWPVFRIYTEE